MENESFWQVLKDVGRAFYQFGDPSGVGNGWWGIVILLIWGIGFIAVPLLIAKRAYGKHEWVSATMGVIAGLAAFWWVYGILPSAWIYFLDSSKELLADHLIPSSAGITGPWPTAGFAIVPADYRLDLASNLYQVIRDTVVVLEHGVAFGLTFWAALRIQKKYPKSLAPGEIKPEAGGYK